MAEELVIGIWPAGKAEGEKMVRAAVWSSRRAWERVPYSQLWVESFCAWRAMRLGSKPTLRVQHEVAGSVVARAEAV